MFKNCNKYEYGKTFLKSYGVQEIKLTQMFVCRNSGVEDDKKHSKKCSVNDEKLLNNVIRAKSKVKELCLCNEWQWFFTGTLDSSKYDRKNLKKYHHDLTQWIRDCNKQYNTKIDFIFVPELHQDGESWHMHGLLNGLPVEHLTQFKIGDTMGKYIAEKVKKGDAVYNWKKYVDKFGFCNLEPIKNQCKVSRYLTKYISKDLYKSVTELNSHIYYCSRGLKRAETVKEGYMSWDNIQPSFVNDFCIVRVEPYSGDRLKELSNSIY